LESFVLRAEEIRKIKQVSPFAVNMPTDFEFDSLRLAHRIFDRILWKYVIWFDGRTSHFCYMTQKLEIHRWAMFEIFLVFQTSIFWPAATLLCQILSPNPNLSLVSSVCLGFYLTNGLLMFFLASSCCFFKADICSAERDIIQELKDPSMGNENYSCF
jgi:hypothetical protein